MAAAAPKVAAGRPLKREPRACAASSTTDQSMARGQALQGLHVRGAPVQLRGKDGTGSRCEGRLGCGRVDQVIGTAFDRHAVPLPAKWMAAAVATIVWEQKMTSGPPPGSSSGSGRGRVRRVPGKAARKAIISPSVAFPTPSACPAPK